MQIGWNGVRLYWVSDGSGALRKVFLVFWVKVRWNMWHGWRSCTQDHASDGVQISLEVHRTVHEIVVRTIADGNSCLERTGTAIRSASDMTSKSSCTGQASVVR